MPANTMTIRIGGREYTLSTEQNEELALRIAAYVDRKVNEVSLHTAMNPEIAAVVAALSIAEELFKAQEANDILRNRLYQAANGEETELP